MLFLEQNIMISIHALRGEGDKMTPDEINKNWISIHALRGEGDKSGLNVKHGITSISIHALRGEGDKAKQHAP